MWTKLVTLDTLFRYCEGLEPIAAAHRYNLQVYQRKSANTFFFFFFKLLTSVHLCAEMDAAKRNA